MIMIIIFLSFHFYFQKCTRGLTTIESCALNNTTRDIHLTLRWTFQRDVSAIPGEWRQIWSTDLELALNIRRVEHDPDWIEELVMDEKWRTVDYMELLM